MLNIKPYSVEGVGLKIGNCLPPLSVQKEILNAILKNLFLGKIIQSFDAPYSKCQEKMIVYSC